MALQLVTNLHFVVDSRSGWVGRYVGLEGHFLIANDPFVSLLDERTDGRRAIYRLIEASQPQTQQHSEASLDIEEWPFQSILDH